MNIESLENIKNNKKETLNKLRNSLNPVVIYGAGRTAERITSLLKDNNIEVVAYFVDEKYYKPNVVVNNIEVVTLKSINEKYKLYNVVFGFYEYGKVKQILNSGIFDSKGIVGFFDGVEEFDYEYIRSNLKNFKETYNLLCDELSKEIYIEYLKARLSGVPQGLVEHCSRPQYFIDKAKLLEDEIFIDCGCFDGDTIFEFNRISKGKYKKIYGFEPDSKNYKNLCENTANLQHVELINKGVWESTDTLKFKMDGTSSNISDKGDIEVLVTSIDEVVGDNDVTFIKMDIEGSELKALRGAKNTINRCTPKLAICVYHKKEDMITIPQYINKLNPDYDLYLRHHSLASYETVLYAIPKKTPKGCNN